MAAGLVPATLEMVDNRTINAIEDSMACGFPREAAAVLVTPSPELAAAVVQLIWQVVDVKLDDPKDCLAKFRSNRLVGWILLAANSCLQSGRTISNVSRLPLPSIRDDRAPAPASSPPSCRRLWMVRFPA